MKKQCKECGEWFEATNARQLYCNKMHYRPCPGCGKVLETTRDWLSYPARFCSRTCSANFKKNGGVVNPSTNNDSNEEKQTMPKVYEAPQNNRLNVEDMLENHTVVLAHYTGPKTCGWIPGHNYLVTLLRNSEHTYMMKSEKDCTDNVDINIGITLSSQISINQTFQLV